MMLFIILLIFPVFIGAVSYNLNSYNKVIYVSTTGSDSLGNGSEGNPYATVNKAVEAAASSGDAIYIKPGEYDVTNSYSFGQNSGLNNFGKNVDFIGVPKETVLYIHGEIATDRDMHFYSGTGFSKIYNMFFIRNSNNRSTNYMNSFFGFGFVQGEIYNSVFKTINCPAPSLTYNNSGAVSVKVYNSVFDLETNMVNSYTGASNTTQIINSVSDYSFAISDGNYYSNNLTNASFDSNYNILTSGWQNTGTGLDPDGSQADLGVYGGLNSWNSFPTVPEASNVLMMLLGMLVIMMSLKNQI